MLPISPTTDHLGGLLLAPLNVAWIVQSWALVAATSFAVVGYFAKRPEAGLSAWSSRIAPAIAGILLVVILVLGVLNFNVLITSATDAPTDKMAVILPLILLAGGVLGLIVGARLKARRPDVYARIGEGRS